MEQALARGIMEELEIDVNKLEDLEFFKKFDVKNNELNIAAELNVFLCKMPNIDNLKCNEGKAKIVKLSEAINLNISPWDKQIL